MQIEENRVVTIDYTVTDVEGNVLDSSQGNEPLQYIHGGGNVIAGLEQALEGAEPGTEKEFKVPPDQGYGEREDGLIMTVDRSAFQDVDEPKVGMRFRGRTESGERVFTVAAVEEQKVTVDGNHPLAGMTLKFQVAVKDVRDATDEEIEHAHVH